jgi:cell fate regulator YaaT (PSP1 superfamily)
MASQHLVRIGALGQVGRFASADALLYPRGVRVVVRTERGLEVGEVLAQEMRIAGAADGTILRRVAVEDELLLARLERKREEAFDACAERIRSAQLPAALMEVEPLLDGTLVFYFLGDGGEELARITGELAELYESKAQLRQFAETLTQGCGPGCGTEDASGGGCGSCGAGCAVAGACGPRVRGAGDGSYVKTMKS